MRGRSTSPPSTYLDRFDVDSAVYDARAVRYLVDVMGPSSVLLGSDYPFPLGEEHVGEVIRSCGFEAEVEHRLLGANAVEFFEIGPGWLTSGSPGPAWSGRCSPSSCPGAGMTSRSTSVAPTRRQADAAGRSINLALSARGIDALERVGLADAVIAHGLAMRGRMVHDRTGKLAYQAYSADGSKAINSISRHGLNSLLLDAAEDEKGVTICFEQRAVDADRRTPARSRSSRRTAAHTATHDVVIGADGAYSAVRDAIVRGERADYSQDHLPWGYKELTIAPDASGRLRPRPRRAAHLAPRRLDDDRPAQPRPHASPPPCSGRSTARLGSPASTRPTLCGAASSATTPTPRRCSRTSSASSPSTRSARWSR